MKMSDEKEIDITDVDVIKFISELKGPFFRNVKYTQYYPSQELPVISLGIYFSKNQLYPHELSKKIVYLKQYGTNIHYFRRRLDVFYENFIEAYDIDKAIIMPAHNSINPNPGVKQVFQPLCEKFDIEVLEILSRRKTANRMIGLSFKERYENIFESLDADYDGEMDDVIIFDDICTTGLSLLELQRVINQFGLKNTLGITLGTNFICLEDTLTHVTPVKDEKELNDLLREHYDW